MCRSSNGVHNASSNQHAVSQCFFRSAHAPIRLDYKSVDRFPLLHLFP